MSQSIEEKSNTKAEIEIMSLGDPESRKKAIESIQKGHLVAAQMRNVFGFWIDAHNDNARQLLADIKKEKVGKKLSTMIPGRIITPLIDITKISSKLKGFVTDPNTYSDTFGSICHTVLPLKSEGRNILPDSILSNYSDSEGTPVVYNLDPTGHPPMQAFIEELQAQGIFCGVTSMNTAGTPEITNLEDATTFLQQLNFPTALLRDSYPCRPEVIGSFPQINFIEGTIIRDGHIPVDLLSVMYNVESSSSLKAAKYKVDLPYQWPLLSSLADPKGMRQNLLDFIHYQHDPVPLLNDVQ